MAADRELLFGILAVQNDCVTRKDFIAGVQVWLQDKSNSLAAILNQRGSITDTERDLIEKLTQLNMDRNKVNLEQSLARLNGVGDIANELAQLGDPEINDSLRTVTIGLPAMVRAPGSGIGKSSNGSSEKNGSRFRILCSHARGGLGEIFIAVDEELNREVALKEIQARFVDDPGICGRFLFEAEITGCLEHPGIVPVYGFGRYGNGQPFYAMRLIRGESLKQAACRLHELKKTATHKSIEFRGLLNRFVDVCQAIEYAHSRGVIHRDIKPDNIMLGKFGETLVVDWGLAKKNSGGSSETIDSLGLKCDGIAETVVGTAMGSPQYMPPEQADGDLDAISFKSDVYSLGATLVYILTARSPVAGDTQKEILSNVIDGNVHTRSNNPRGVPKALWAIGQKAMAYKPELRYSSANQLMQDVENFLADEPVSAIREPSMVRIGRWFRKKPRLTTGAITFLLMGLIASWAVVGLVRDFNRDLELSNAQLNKKNKALDQSNKEILEQRIDALITRGQWQEGLSQVERYESEFDALPLRMRLLRMDAYDGLLMHDELRAEIRALESSPSSSAVGEEIELWQAYLSLSGKSAQKKLGVLPSPETKLGEANLEFLAGLKLGVSPEALSRFRNSLAISPFHLRARVELITLLLLSGKYEETQEEVRTAKSFFPDDPRFYYIDALSHASVGRYEEARSALNEISQNFPEFDTQSLRQQLNLYKNFNQAIDNVISPPSVFVWIKLVSIHQSIASDSRKLGFDSLVPGISRSQAFEGLKILRSTFLDPQIVLSSSKRTENVVAGMQKAYDAHPDGLYKIMEGFAFANKDYKLWIRIFDQAAESNNMFPRVRRQALLWAAMSRAALVKTRTDKEGLPDYKLMNQARKNLEDFLLFEGKIQDEMAEVIINIALNGRFWELALSIVSRQIADGGDEVKWWSFIKDAANKRNDKLIFTSALEKLIVIDPNNEQWKKEKAELEKQQPVSKPGTDNH